MTARPHHPQDVPRVLDKLGDDHDPLFELALRLEEVALKDDYFVERKLYPTSTSIRA